MPLLDQGAPDEWTTSLFQCCQDVPGTFDMMCCFPCQYGRMCHVLNAESSGAANELDVKWCAIACILAGCGVHCLTLGFRSKLRERFGISGGFVTDCLASFLCTACSNCQHSRELTNHGHWPGGTVCARNPPGGIG